MAAPDSMTDTEVWNLIFEPGFSTAEIAKLESQGVLGPVTAKKANVDV